MRLSEIGDKYGTQKNTHISFGHTLLDIYEPLFERFVNQQGVVVLEIGVLNGASLKVWREYFNTALVIGMDINPDALYYISDPGVHLQIGNQSKEEDLQKLVDITNGKFDIIIDDGSHVNKYTLKSFDFLWPHLSSGGYYIIEDTICSYDKVDLEWPGMNRNRKNMNVNNNRKDVDKWLLRHIMDVDFEKTDIFSIQIFRNVIILQKA